MSDLRLIEAVRAGDLEMVRRLIESGDDINQRDEQGWMPLHWAAGKGDVGVVNVLLEKGAAIGKVGRDQRTPYLIALAASNVEVARLLRKAEGQPGLERAGQPGLKYCRPYHLSELRAFPRWSESRINWKQNDSDNAGSEHDELSDNDIVFLHQDFVVTKSMWQDENIIYNQVDPEWERFCTNVLRFNVPDLIDLVSSAKGTAS